MTDNVPNNQNWQVAEPEQVSDAKELVIPLKRPLTVNGIEYESVTIRYPTRGDANRLRKEKKKLKITDDDHEQATAVMISYLATKPEINLATMEEMAQSDFMYIQSQLNKAGYMGIIEMNEDEDWNVASPEEVLDSPEITIKLKRKFQANGVEHDAMKLRYPRRRDMSEIAKLRKRVGKNQDEDELQQQLILRLAVDPPVSPEDLDTLAVSDFTLILKKLNESGFFGIMRTTT